VRENRSFHAPEDARPLILIGNGTGIAGLRAHLHARARAGHQRNWLLFGERTAQHDFFFRSEIEAWRDTGILERVDLAFSRDQTARRYVQHLVAAAAAEGRRRQRGAHRGPRRGGAGATERRRALPKGRVLAK
jgi:sulfite reductase (NADPH) flavoprotein alpha-component